MNTLMKIFAAALLHAVFLLWSFGTPAFAIEKGTQHPPDTADLKPDEYTWNPEACPAVPWASLWTSRTR